MKKNKLLKLILLFLIATSFIYSSQVTASTSRETCPINSSDPNCLPPTLGDAQTTIVSLIGTAYSMVGFIFLGILVYNGLIYLIGYLEDAKFILGASIEDVQKRMTQWLTGFLMVLISYPLINGFMKTIVSDSSCYTKLNNPMVQFIFPEVCSPTNENGGNNNDSTITPTTETTVDPSPIAQDVNSCSNYVPMVNSIGGAINFGTILYTSDDLCRSICSQASTHYMKNGEEPFNYIYCDCTTNTCWAVTSK